MMVPLEDYALEIVVCPLLHYYTSITHPVGS
jgi:hypothetical protein